MFALCLHNLMPKLEAVWKRFSGGLLPLHFLNDMMYCLLHLLIKRSGQTNQSLLFTSERRRELNEILDIIQTKPIDVVRSMLNVFESKC